MAGPQASRFSCRWGSKRIRPLRLILEEDFAQQTNRRRAVAEDFVVKLLEAESVPLLLAIVFAKLEDLQLAHGVVQVLGIERAANRFLPRRLLFVIAIVLKELCSFVHGHALAVHTN